MQTENMIDYDRLTEQGYIVLPGLIPAETIQRLESELADFAAVVCDRFGIDPGDDEPFIHAFKRGRRWTDQVYKLMEELFVLHEMSVEIGRRLRASGFLEWAGLRVPLIWPDIRVDAPNDARVLTPMHQDFGSTRCHRAWRIWAPLRKADAHHGSMVVLPGTHKLGPIPHDMGDELYPCVAPEHYRDAEQIVMDLPAGDGVLIDPMLVHASVPNRSDRMKLTALIQVQDLAAVSDPDDPADPLRPYLESTARRAQARTTDPRYTAP